MEIVRAITRTTHLLGAALLLAGCTDNATAPPAAKTAPTGTAAARVIDLTKRPTLKAVVKTVVTYRDKAGKIQRNEFSQNVTANFKRGLAIARVDLASADKPSAAFANTTDGVAAFAQYTTDPTSMTPVLAVASGVVAYNYADTLRDSVGNVTLTYAWAASAGTPITDAWAYRNGVLIVQYHANWNPVSGGYTLANQTIGSYQANGVLAGTVVSTVTGSGSGGRLLTENEESLGAKPLRLALDALHEVECWLSPKVAYANQSPLGCTGEVVSFMSHTFTLGTMTYEGVAFVAPGWYLLEWGVWTHSMYELASCFSPPGYYGPPRGTNACKTNPKLCTGGGGTTW